MSWYYTYYIGVLNKEGKLYPFAPYDKDGKLYHVLENSRSFEYGLHESFLPIKEEMVTEEFKKQFPYYEEEKSLYTFAYVKDLGSSEYIKDGYFLIDDVEEYVRTKDSYDIFYDRLSPIAYAAKLLNEKTLGEPIKEANEDEDDEYSDRKHPASDYMYFAYPDYYCKEYHASIIKTVLDMVCDSYDMEEKELTPVIILTQG